MTPLQGLSRYHSMLFVTDCSMLKSFDYQGHEVHATVLPEQGRWAYRIDGQEVHFSKDSRPATEEDVLFALAEAAAKAHIDAAERRRTVRAERESRDSVPAGSFDRAAAPPNRPRRSMPA
jgi:hypothetical protein